MSRQESTNTFTDGLVMDLNPLTTPDSVLTDNLNGTIITYNDNEFVLQNDQGNYKLQNARLRQNFIPVGVKQYGNILYIVSYNPITKETEVGTYPSPRRIFSTNDRDQVVEFIPIVPNGTTVNDTYENLTKDIKLQIYTLSSDNNSYLINPGDEFRLQVEQDLDFIYQKIDFAILSDDRELYDIDIPDEYLNQLEFKKVFWNIPGWLTGRYTLANLNQFYLNIRNLSLPEFIPENTFDIVLNLNSQMEISDELFLNSPTVTTDLKVQLNIRVVTNGTETYNQTIYSDVLTRHDYNNVNSIYFYNFNNIEIGDRTLDDIIYVSAVPILQYGGSTIVYEQFRTNEEINLAAVSDANTIEAANLIFKHIVDDDSITLSFDVTGPFVNNSSIELWYDIYNLSGTQVESQRLIDANLFGQNTVDIPFTSTFLKEDVYLLVLRFMQGVEEIRNINKVLITSETFNDYYNTVSEFNTGLYAQDWVGKYIETWKFDEGSYAILDKDNITYGPITQTGPTPVWPTNYVTNNSVTDSIAYKLISNVNMPITAYCRVDRLTGLLWSNATQSLVLNSGGDTYNITNGSTQTLNVNFEASSSITYKISQGSNVSVPVYNSSKLTYSSNYVNFYSVAHGGSGTDFQYSVRINDINSVNSAGSFVESNTKKVNSRTFGTWTTYMARRLSTSIGIVRFVNTDQRGINRDCDVLSNNNTGWNKSSNNPFCGVYFNTNITSIGGNQSCVFLLEGDVNTNIQNIYNAVAYFCDNSILVTSYSSPISTKTYVVNTTPTILNVDSYTWGDLSYVATLESDPFYIGNSITANVYTQPGLNQLLSRLNSVQTSLTQVNVTPISTINFTYTISSDTFNRTISLNLPSLDTVYYSVYDNSGTAIGNIQAEALNQFSISATQITNAENNLITGTGLFYIGDNSTYRNAFDVFKKRLTGFSSPSAIKVNNASNSPLSVTGVDQMVALMWQSAGNWKEKFYWSNIIEGVKFPAAPTS